MGDDRFSCEDVEQLVEVVARDWRRAAGNDWSARAGTLDWTCTQTADHAVDTTLAPAFFLASRKTDAYPDIGPFTLGPDARPEQLADGLEAAGRILVAVVGTTPPEVRAIIWRRPVETRGPADFVPRAGLELILHAHDVAAGLGVEFDPPTQMCEHLRRHTASWPFWTAVPGWKPLTLTGDPWADLLQASGRQR